ncbi:MAG: HAD hydrolase-like protein [Bacteroidota bacterium]
MFSDIDNNQFNINKSKYSHFIFDWNGTLMDDLWLAVDVIDKMLVKRGLSGMTIEHYSEVFDFPVKDYYEKIGFDFQKESFELIGTEFIDGYNERQYECKLQVGANELLRNLSRLPIQLSVLSARIQHTLEENLDHYGIYNHFMHVAGLDDHYANGKLGAGIELLNKTSIPKGDTLMIGDTLHDAEVAKELGIDCVLVVSGHQSEKRLLSANVPVFDTLVELNKVLLA